MFSKTRRTTVVPALAGLILVACSEAYAGSQIAFTSLRDGDGWEIYVMEAYGSRPVNVTNHPGDDGCPVWSPFGTHIAFMSNRSGNSETYVMDVDGSNPINLTNHSAQDGFPSWSPDGTKIAFTSARDGNRDIYVMAADGSHPINLTNDPALDGFANWSPDGSAIAFTSNRAGNT